MEEVTSIPERNGANGTKWGHHRTKSRSFQQPMFDWQRSNKQPEKKTMGTCCRNCQRLVLRKLSEVHWSSACSAENPLFPIPEPFLYTGNLLNVTVSQWYSQPIFIISCSQHISNGMKLILALKEEGTTNNYQANIFFIDFAILSYSIPCGITLDQNLQNITKSQPKLPPLSPHSPLRPRNRSKQCSLGRLGSLHSKGPQLWPRESEIGKSLHRGLSCEPIQI